MSRAATGATATAAAWATVASAAAAAAFAAGSASSTVGPSVFDLSVSGPPPATSEGPGPLRRKQKQNVFKRFSGLWALE